MRQKYGKDAFLAVSVSLDGLSEEDRKKPEELERYAATRKRVEKFLAAQKADFPNFILDIPPAEWQKKLKVDGPPCVYVFNKENRIVKKLPVLDAKGETTEKVDYAVIDKLVADLLKK
jgi:hypothetical protein